jgi:plastocyanin
MLEAPMKRALALTVALSTAMLAAVPAEAGRTPRYTVKVGDYFLSPAKKTVTEGTRVTWKWPSVSGDVHDVKLKKGPRGLSRSFKRRFHSDLVSSDYSYAKTLRVPGKYTIICTLHEDDMTQVITVKRKRRR